MPSNVNSRGTFQRFRRLAIRGKLEELGRNFTNAAPILVQFPFYDVVLGGRLILRNMLTVTDYKTMVVKK